ncbi:erythromycin esterase family protein [Amycolatopsis suaedae]|uniref:Erythromycin esterase family protein n=1 Tax=Amycolatopsis suaedae TaxID=2510978 RepID=A0A4Q7JFF6_9PSEU|nr:erythromycin esterase family protein [Amycolatopsis suaedae]RZQ65956.1 erythromycin esterase family protein [Amycolatopsis suaedae]
MSALDGIGRQAGEPESLHRALDELLATRPALLALGEPAHGIEAFLTLRNEILAHLVERGYRSITLETDVLAASAVDDYVGGGAADIGTVLATGFSHGFGALPGNRALVEWLREYNAGRAPADRVRFHGFDAPGEFSGVPSPREALHHVLGYLPAAARPGSAGDVDSLLGDEAAWREEAAMFDPSASIGGSGRVRALRVVADDLASVLSRAESVLRPADPAAYDRAVTHLRTARGLLRYHAAMAGRGPDRVATLMSLRAETMAANLRAIVAGEQGRGPGLVFAHNGILQRAPIDPPGGEDMTWPSAGGLVGHTLGERYAFVATDTGGVPGTFQGALAEATTGGRALFPARELLAALPPSAGAGEPIMRGHLPLTPGELRGAAAVIFVTGAVTL